MKVSPRIMLVVLFSVAVTVARGDDRNWLTAGGGFFNTPTNWSDNTVPGAADNAIFNLGGDYKVTFETAVTNNDLSVNNDTVTFNLNSQTYTLGNRLYVGRASGTGHATITNGTLTSATGWIGFLATDTGTLVLHSADWNSGNTYIGFRGEGHLRIEAGAKVGTALLSMGDQTNAVGRNSLVLTGAGTVLTTSGSALMARYAEHGSVSVSSGAVWNLQSNFLLASGAGSEGAMEVDNATLLQTGTGYFYVGNAGTATMAFRNGAVLTNASSGILSVGHATGAHGTLIVESGSRFIHSADMFLARNTTATGIVTVAGSGSRLEALNLYVGGLATAARGPGSLTVADQAGVGVTSNLIVWSSGELVLDGGSMTATTVDLRSGSDLKVALHAGQAHGAPLMAASGNAAVGGAVLEVSLAAGYTPAGEVFTLLRADGTLAGLFKDSLGVDILDGDTVWEDALDPDNYYVRLNYVDGTGGDPSYITLTAIPEPSLLGLLGFGLLFLYRRRGK